MCSQPEAATVVQHSYQGQTRFLEVQWPEGQRTCEITREAFQGLIDLVNRCYMEHGTES